MGDLISKSNDQIVHSKATIMHRLLQQLPFSWLTIVKRQMDLSGKNILDVGCGYGFPMETINRSRKFETVGVDIFAPYLKDCQKKKIHNNYVLCDVNYLPFRDKTFDVVICLEVIEHLNKNDSINLILRLETIARKQVILSTPVGWCHQHESDSNKYMSHKSAFELKEFKKIGYNVKGWGLKFLYGKRSPAGGFGWMLVVSSVATYGFGIVAYFFPSLAGHMVCTKNLVDINDK